MSEPIVRLEWLQWPETRKLIEAFDYAGEDMRFVGGCVRDAVLGRKVTDVDIAASAPPQHTLSLLESAGIKVIPTGISHGTVTAIIGKKHFEITTLRKDTACDGRHAKVEFTDDWKEDAARRDLTMNALYATPKGEIIDYFSGIKDAEAGRIAFIGDPNQRITEDYLRILRFFRFHAYFGKGMPDKLGLEACGKHAEQLRQLSGERIQAEMLKLLAAPNPVHTLLLMIEQGVLKQLLGFEASISGMDELPAVEVKSKISPDPLRRLAALLRSGGAQVVKHTEHVSQRWKLSNQMEKRLFLLASPPVEVDSHMSEKLIKKAIRQVGNALFKDLVLLDWAKQEAPEHVAAYRPMLRWAEEWQAPEFPLKGSDLLALGFKTGPQLGKKLEELEAFWEEEDYQPDKDALIARAKQ